MLVLDALSRTYIKNWKPEFDEDSLEQFKEETRKYYTRNLPIVVTYLTMKDYFSKISEIFSEMKSILHQEHLDIENCKREPVKHYFDHLQTKN